MGTRLKLFLPLLVVAVVLIGGYFVSTWIRDRGSGDGADAAVAAAEKTATGEESERSATPRPTRTRTATSRSGTATASPTAPPRNLDDDEDRGGHTLSRHVGRTDADLRQRLKDEPDISAASTYSDQESAERSVGLALSQNAARVGAWEKASSHPNLVVRVTMASTIGRSLKRGDSAAKNVKDAVVVLKWDKGGWYVLTSYPEER